MSRRITSICLLTDEVIHVATCESRGRKVTIVAESELPFSLPDSLLVEHDGEALANAIADACRNAGRDASHADLVLPLNWCFTQMLKVDVKRTQVDALRYEFEPYLPVPLEELTCAFLPVNERRILGVAVPTEPLRALLEALSREGVEFEHIGIDVLALWYGRTPAEHQGCFTLLDVRWIRTFDPSSDQGTMLQGIDVEVSIFQQLAHHHDHVVDREGILLPLTDAVAANVPDNADSSAHHASTMDEAIEGIARGEILCSRQFNLRSGELTGVGPREEVFRCVNQCLASAALLVLVLIAGFRMQTHAFQQVISQVDHARQEIYRTVFENSTMPPSAALRLASERIRLEGLTRVPHKSNADTAKVMPPALDLLREVTTRLPSDVRIMLAEARADDVQLSLRGQTVEHPDAERIVQAIRGIPGLEVRPPRTNRLASGEVEFAISAGPGNEH